MYNNIRRYYTTRWLVCRETYHSKRINSMRLQDDQDIRQSSWDASRERGHARKWTISKSVALANHTQRVCLAISLLPSIVVATHFIVWVVWCCCWWCHTRCLLIDVHFTCIATGHSGKGRWLRWIRLTLRAGDIRLVAFVVLGLTLLLQMLPQVRRRWHAVRLVHGVAQLLLVVEHLQLFGTPLHQSFEVLKVWTVEERTQTLQIERHILHRILWTQENVIVVVHSLLLLLLFAHQLA